jgi:hypothetical protein
MMNKTKQLESLLCNVQARLARLLPGIADDETRAALSHVLTDLGHALTLVIDPDGLGQRAALRFHEDALLVAKMPGNRIVECAVHDISAGGALLEIDGSFDAGTAFHLKVPGLGRDISATILGHSGEGSRVQFEPLSHTEETALRKYLERHLVES